MPSKQIHALFTLLRRCTAGTFSVASQFQNVAGYYLFWTTPAYFILAGVACEQVWKAVVPQSDGKTVGMLMPCVLVVTLFSQTYLYFQIENGGRPRWREAFEAIQVEKRSTDKVVLSEPEMGRYYLPELTQIYIGTLLDDKEGFEETMENFWERAIVVCCRCGEFQRLDADMAVRSWIRERGYIVKTFPAFSRVKDRTIYVYLLR